MPPTLPPPSNYLQPNFPPPVVNNQPPPTVFIPPNIPQTPQTPLVPRIPGTNIPAGPVAAPMSPIPALPMPPAQAGVNGLGDVGQAQQVLRHYETAYRAIQANKGLFDAVRRGLASPEQRQAADEVAGRHAEGIRAIGQFSPATIQTAAHGLGFLGEEKPLPKFPGTRRHREHDDAAE
jgi:hypothetical protein